MSALPLWTAGVDRFLEPVQGLFARDCRGSPRKSPSYHARKAVMLSAASPLARAALAIEIAAKESRAMYNAVKAK